MTNSIKATRATIAIGSLTVDGFMLPDGAYRMSLSQAAECIGLSARNAFDFLESRALKSLIGEGYTLSVSEIESEENQGRGGSRIRALPLEVVRKYWLWRAFRGNKQALALVDALMAETLDRRFDAAFDITRSESEYNDRLSQRMQQLERDLERLSEGFATEDKTRQERDYFERLLRERGIDPWNLPGSSTETN